MPRTRQLLAVATLISLGASRPAYAGKHVARPKEQQPHASASPSSDTKSDIRSRVEDVESRLDRLEASETFWRWVARLAHVKTIAWALVAAISLFVARFLRHRGRVPSWRDRIRRPPTGSSRFR